MRAAPVLATLVLLGCGGRPAPAAPPSSTGPTEAAPASPPGTVARTDDDRDRCYPYLPAADGTCPTSCRTRDDCAGSRGPADLAENGWPLDCINDACVPLPPSHVHGHP